MNRKAEITAALDQEVREAVAGAAYFVASLYHEHAHERHPLRTLELARAVAKLLPRARKSERKAIVYAISANERSVMVPEDFVP